VSNLIKLILIIYDGDFCFVLFPLAIVLSVVLRFPESDYLFGIFKLFFVLDQHAQLDFFDASSLKQQSTDRQISPIGNITSQILL